MSALTELVDGLEERLKRVQDSRRAHIPYQRYLSASVALQELLEPFTSLCHRHRFVQAVTRSNAGVELDELRLSVQGILRADFQAFVNGHLTRDTSDLTVQTRTLKTVVETHIKVLNVHVDTFRRAMAARIDKAQVQVNLFAALGIADHRDDIRKLNLRFTMLMRRYEERAWTASTAADWQALEHDLEALQQQVTFDRRVGLSEEALQFVRRILAGGNQAPSMLDLTRPILAEIQNLREFAATVRIMRPD